MYVDFDNENSWAFITQFETVGCDPEVEWKPINGYEGYYEVCNKGKVRSLSRLTKFGNQTKYVIGRELVIKRRKGKYPFVILSKENIQKSHMIHRLVAEAFVPNPNNLPCVNHVMGDKNDARFYMLEWTTYGDNILHAQDAGLMKTRKLTKNQVSEIRASNLTDTELSKIYGVRQGNIWNIRNHKSWKHL